MIYFLLKLKIIIAKCLPLQLNFSARDFCCQNLAKLDPIEAGDVTDGIYVVATSNKIATHHNLPSPGEIAINRNLSSLLCPHHDLLPSSGPKHTGHFHGFACQNRVDILKVIASMRRSHVGDGGEDEDIITTKKR